MSAASSSLRRAELSLLRKMPLAVLTMAPKESRRPFMSSASGSSKPL